MGAEEGQRTPASLLAKAPNTVHLRLGHEPESRLPDRSPNRSHRLRCLNSLCLRGKRFATATIPGTTSSTTSRRGLRPVSLTASAPRATRALWRRNCGSTVLTPTSRRSPRRPPRCLKPGPGDLASCRWGRPIVSSSSGPAGPSSPTLLLQQPSPATNASASALTSNRASNRDFLSEAS